MKTKTFLILSALFLLQPAILKATTFHVAPDGCNTNGGTLAAPFRTIQHAADQAQPGDTVLVAPGVYRERIAPPRGGNSNNPITYRSDKLHGAIIRGSDPWTSKWQRKAPQVWSGTLEANRFTDISHCDGPNPFLVPVSSTPGGREGKPECDRGFPKSDPKLIFSLGQVFVDGRIFEQVPKETEMLATPNTWFYDANSNQLTIHFADDKPDEHVVEVTNQRRLFAPHKRQLAYIIVDGFIFEHCGNQYPTNFWEAKHPEWQQAGAVGTRSGRNWIIRNNIIRFANGIGIDLGNEGNAQADLEIGDNGSASGSTGHLVENNVISDNGAGGTASYNGNNLIVRGNVVERNNRLRFTGKKRWESAGIKLHNPSNSVIEHNRVCDNFGRGIWCDEGAGQDTRIVGNIVINHATGMDFEIGTAKPAILANNIFLNNEVAIKCREAGGIMIAHNLILDSKVAGIEFTIDPKRSGNWSAAHNTIYNNLFIGGTGLFLKLTPPDAVRSGDRRLDRNVYTALAQEPRYTFDKEPPMALDQWQARWKAYNGNANADGGSRAIPGSSYTFNPQTKELSLSIAFDPTTIGIISEPRVAGDYFQEKLPEPLKVPGPFQSLKEGKQTFKLQN